MWFHAVGHFTTDTRYWWNRSREDLVADVVLPLIGKEIRLLNRRGRKTVFNYGAIYYLDIVKTERKLRRPGKSRPPAELKDSDFIRDNNATEEFVNELRMASASTESKSLLQQSIRTPLKQIFVIMKFGDRHLDSAYSGVIKPLGEEFGYRVLRVDEIQDSGMIAMEVLENISHSELIIAELSGERPNCYYEAGFAHALGKTIIFSVNEQDQVHFDLAGHRFIRWSTEAELRRLLRDRLESYTSKATETGL